jgi:RNA 2',3'-cyclic 3'-phosphodiesterase
MTQEQPGGETMRLFVAVELPQAWTEALAQMQRRLAALLETPQTPRLRWVRPEGIHATLKFLGGSVPADLLPDIERAIGGVVTSSPDLRLRLGQAGFFTGPGHSLRVLWAGLQGDVQALGSLAGAIDSALQPVGFGGERRPFEAHLTLARTSDRHIITVDQALRDRLRTVELPEVQELLVQRVSLMRSHLERGGARYERLASWPAGGQA